MGWKKDKGAINFFGRFFSVLKAEQRCCTTSRRHPMEDAEDRGGDQGQVCCMGQALPGGPSRSRRGEGRKFEFGRQVGGTIVCGAAVGIGVDGFHARVLLDLSDECC